MSSLGDIEKLEAALWEAADTLRGNSKPTSSEYCMPVLGVIFLRHAANRFEVASQKIADDQASGKMPKRKVRPEDYVTRRARRMVQHGDLLWSCVRPNRKSYAVVWNPAENLIASTGFAVITPTKVPTTFLEQATTTDDFVGYLENNAKGAAYPAVLASDFKRAELLVPSEPLLNAFNAFAEPLLAQRNNLEIQTRKLRAARDRLLPKLMNGEIEV